MHDPERHVNGRRCAPVVAFALLIAQSCSTSAPAPPAYQSVTSSAAHLPVWLPGVWTREWIERGGSRTSSFDVHYLQTPSAFADVRIPRERAALTHAASFADLSDGELLLLARQRGFTGTTTIAGDVATWHHEIDFQPPDSSPDIGRVERLDDAHMLEHALDRSYVESWRSVENGGGLFLTLRIVRGGRIERVLVIVGNHFLYVRNRGGDLPAAESLDSLIVSTKATRAQIIAYLDCEFSEGLVHGGSAQWEIQHSTLPWREGRRLDLVDSVTESGGVLRLRAPYARGAELSVPVNTFPASELEKMFEPRR
jgi:hypothetical protein